MTADMGTAQVRASTLAYCADMRPRGDVLDHIMRLSSKLDREMASRIVLDMTGRGWLDLDGQGNQLQTTEEGEKALSRLEAEGWE